MLLFRYHKKHMVGVVRQWNEPWWPVRDVYQPSRAKLINQYQSLPYVSHIFDWHVLLHGSRRLAKLWNVFVYRYIQTTLLNPYSIAAHSELPHCTKLFASLTRNQLYLTIGAIPYYVITLLSLNYKYQTCCLNENRLCLFKPYTLKIVYFLIMHLLITNKRPCMQNAAFQSPLLSKQLHFAKSNIIYGTSCDAVIH